MYHFKKNGYVLSHLTDDSGKSTYWISKEGCTDMYYCFSASDDRERDYQIQNGFESYVAMYEQNHARLFGGQTQSAPAKAAPAPAHQPNLRCATCDNRATRPNYLSCRCLACKHAYCPGTDAYDQHVDHYTPEQGDEHD